MLLASCLTLIPKNRILSFCCIAVFYSLLSITILGQEHFQLLEESLEEYAINNGLETTENIALDEWTDELDFFKVHPLNLNTATYEELARLRFLTTFQIQSILDYRKHSGNFLSVYELAYLYGFTEQDAKLLAGYVSVYKNESIPKEKFKQSLTTQKYELITHVKRNWHYAITEDYLQGKHKSSLLTYPADPNAYTVRFRNKYNPHFKFGLVAEKDAGEEFFTGSNKQGFDHYAGYMQLRDIGFLKNLVVGDYRLSVGQGLILWNSISMGKGFSTGQIMKYGETLRGYSSTGENLYFRGIASTLKFKSFETTLFLSSKNLDANITDTLTDGSYVFSSFQETGIHSTAGELYDENSIREQMLGTSVKYKRTKLHLGLNLTATYFNGEKESSTLPYKKFAFSGSSYNTASIDYTYNLQPVVLYGESGYSYKGWATIHGLMVQASDRTFVTVVYRNYSKTYYARYAGALSENTSISNEEGLYLKSEFQLSHAFQLLAFYDAYRFPWLKYGVDFPSRGWEYGAQLSYQPIPEFKAYFRWKQETAGKNFTEEGAVTNRIADYQKSKCRLHVQYASSNYVRLDTRVELSSTGYTQENYTYGFLIYQGLHLKMRHQPLTFWMRYTLFDAMDFNARIYSYENDVLYSYSVPFYYGKGYGGYLMAKWEPLKKLSFWLRYSHTRYTDKNWEVEDFLITRQEIKHYLTVQCRWIF